MLDSAPLKDINITHTGTPSTTSMTFDLYLDHGSLGNRTPVEGLTLSQLEAYATSIGLASVTFLTLTDVNGSYTGTYATQASAELLRVQGIATTVQGGFDTKRIDDVLANPIP